MSNASVIALVIVGVLLVLLGVRGIPISTDDGNIVAASSLLLIALGEVALVAAGVLQLAGAKRA